MQTLCRIIQFLLVPAVLMNLKICIWGAWQVLRLKDDLSLLLMIAAVVLGIGAWAGNGAAFKVLTGTAPAWMKLIWLPGTIFTVVVTFVFYISPSVADDVRPQLGDLLARASILQLVVAVGLTVLTVGSLTAVILLEKLRTPAPQPRS